MKQWNESNQLIKQVLFKNIYKYQYKLICTEEPILYNFHEQGSFTRVTRAAFKHTADNNIKYLGEFVLVLAETQN